MGQRLKGKNAVVTGAGAGVGRAIALALAEEGANVVVNDLGGATDGTGASARPADDTVEAIKKMGVEAVANYDNVTDFDAAKHIIDTCVNQFGQLDILVNVAGILRDRMVFNMSYEEWDAVLKVHLYGTFNCLRHACTLMKQQKSGRIINTTSDAWVYTIGHVNYGAAKAGIVTLTKSAAREMGRYGVTCNVFAPLAATRLTLSDEVKAGFKKRYESGLMTKERYEELIGMPGPEYVAPFIAYLATDEAADINGCVFQVTGTRVGLYSEPQITRVIHKAEGKWTVDELTRLVPSTLTQGIINPAPPETEQKS